MNDKLNIDKSIKEKLDDFSVAPPSHVWDNIQGQIALLQRKKRMAYISWIAAAAVVIFAFIAGWVLNDNADLVPEMVDQKIEETIDSNNIRIEKAEIAEPQEENVLMASSIEENTISVNSESTRTDDRNRVAIESHKDESLISSLERISFEFLESIEAVLTAEKLVFQLVNHHQPKQKLSLNTYDEILIAENIRNSENQKNTETGWKIGTLVSPGYASYSSNHSQEYAQNMTYSGSSGNTNVGAGVSVQYKTSKRLRVESGVYYSQNGQSSNGSAREFFSFKGNTDYLMAAPEDVSDAAPGFSNTVQLSSNGIAMNSAAGVINMSSAPKGVVVATNAESTNSLVENTLTTSGEFSQVFQFVEVPMYLRYNVLDKRFGIEIMGGLNAGLVVGNNAYIDNEYGKQNIGTTADISTFNLSGTFGVGMNYALGKQFSLALEPRLNYFLNSINSNPEVDYRPYRVGIFTGVYYSF